MHQLHVARQAVYSIHACVCVCACMHVRACVHVCECVSLVPRHSRGGKRLERLGTRLVCVYALICVGIYYLFSKGFILWETKRVSIQYSGDINTRLSLSGITSCISFSTCSSSGWGPLAWGVWYSPALNLHLRSHSFEMMLDSGK